MNSFWILWVFNALMSLVPVYFFFEGLSDGSIDADNLWMWMIILALVALILGGTYWLKTKNQILAAKVLLIIAAIPSLIAILFMSIAIFGDVRWN
ncbi:MAG: osmoprotectant transporter permease [Saprospiraceae bacterium]|nr:osmoprotectant transporter permease [Saprospiraceae bacterium]